MSIKRKSIALLVATVLSPGAHADVVTDWNETLVAVMTAEKTHAPMQSRNAALMHMAVFEAVNAIDKHYMPYRDTLPAPAGASPEAAAATAAHHTLARLYPGQTALLDSSLEKSLAAVPNGAARRDGVNVGERAAALMLDLRASDGSTATIAYVPRTGAGAWVPNPDAPPLAPQWGGVKPWVLKSGAQFRPSGPPALNSAQYRRDYREVKELGGKDSTQRTREQTDIAKFWMPPGVPGWNPVARQLATARALGLAENARLFALLNMAAADAIIACWDTKYGYNFFRPVSAIRQGSDEFAAVPDWEPSVATPPFPAYVSGHACFAGAAQTVLESYFGVGDQPVVRLTSTSTPGMVREFRRISQIVEEISNARIWGGIHWRTDQTDGEVLGRTVGEYTMRHALLPQRMAGE